MLACVQGSTVLEELDGHIFLQFGNKHRGRTLADVAATDHQYLVSQMQAEGAKQAPELKDHLVSGFVVQGHCKCCNFCQLFGSLGML